MEVTNYIQKIDLRRTFTEFTVRLTMSGRYAGIPYQSTPILMLKYDIEKPVDMYVSYDKHGKIIDGYLYLERKNFLFSRITLKTAPKKNWNPVKPINPLDDNPYISTPLNPQQTCVCACYAGAARNTYWPATSKVGESCEQTCMSQSTYLGCASRDSFYVNTPPVDNEVTNLGPKTSTTFLTDVIIPIFDNGKLGLRKLTQANTTSTLTNSRMWRQGKSMLQLRPFKSSKQGKYNGIQLVMPQITNFLYLDQQPVSFNVEVVARNGKTPVNKFIINPTARKTQSRKVKRPIDNLYTPGFEYQRLDGSNYIGYYHIDPAVGPRIGKTGSKAGPRLKSLSFVPSIQVVKPKASSRVPKTQTFYTHLQQKEVEKGKVEFNFNHPIKNFTEFKILKNEVFIVKNDENYSLSLCNVLQDDVRELPYNVTRVVTRGKITPSTPYYEEGVKKYPLSWPVDLSNNVIFSDCKQCMSFSFYSQAHEDNFGQILRQNQIANLEQDYFLNDQQTLSYTPRFFTGLNQWLERSSSDIFSDLQIIRDSKGELDSLQICPSKDTILNGYEGIYAKAQKKCNCLFSNSTDEEIFEVEVDCKDGDCAKCCTAEKSVEGWDDCWTCEEDYSAPIGNYGTDLFTSTYATFKEVFTGGTTYSGYTNTGSTSANTYDIYISASTFSGDTIIPISNIKRIKHRPLANVVDPRYVPHYGYQVFSGNGGNLTIESGNSSNYMTYRVRENGTYRFQYNAYLDVTYQDSKWADYVFSNYLTAATQSIAYPTSDYAIKRLINSSVLRAGADEGDVVLEDTNGQFFPGKNGFAGGSGVTMFDFKVFIERETTATTKTNLDIFTVSNDPVSGVDSDAYLTQSTNKVQDVFSGYTNLFDGAATANTVFRKMIPVSLDTGLVSLSGGDVVRLKYSADWDSTSKGTTGSTAIRLNLGHRLNVSGDPTYSPSYRVVKFDNLYVNKTLFFNAHKQSRAETYYDEKGIKIKKSSQGALYTINNDYEPITTPKVNPSTFDTLTFIDNIIGSKKLELGREANSPTNQWAKQLVEGTLEDYYLPMGELLSVNNGVLTFNLPRYDQDYALSCNYVFPQINHSYVVKTTIGDNNNGVSEMYVVITPSPNLQVPCFTPPLDEQYKLVSSELLSGATIEQYDDEFLIDGKPAVVKTSRSQPLTTTKAPNTFKCQFYCKCQDLDMEGVDPYFGTTSVITDNTVFDCEECEELAANYCGHLSGDCSSIVFTTECQPTSITDPTQTNYAKWTCAGGGQNCTQCTAEFMANNPGVECPYTSCTHCEAQSYYDTTSMCYCNNTGHHRYNCGPLGDCIIDNNGPYMSLGECEDRCSWFIQNNNGNTSNTTRGNYANPILRNTNISGGY